MLDKHVNTTDAETSQVNTVRLIHVTFFKDEYAKTMSTQDMALWELRDLILTTNADAKDDLQFLKLAWFGDTPTEKDCLRNNANVRALSGIVVEHDASTMSFDEAIRRLRTARVEALVYTSPSHTEEQPRWRVVAPTSDSWAPAQHACLVARLNGILGGVLSGESFTLSQSYYFGKINGNPYHRVEMTFGEYINLRFDLDETAIYKKSTSKISNLQLTDVTGINPDIPISGLSDDRLKSLPDPARYMIEHAVAPDNASEKVRKLKGGKGHCYVVGSLIKAGLNNAQIKDVYRLGNIAHGPRNSSRGFDGYVERVIAYCRSREQEQLEFEFDAEIKRLASLSSIQYEQVRKSAALRFGVRTSILDKLVENERIPVIRDKQGGKISFSELEPWPDAIDGVELLNSIADAIRLYVVLSDHARDTTALWVLHCYLLNRFSVSPRLAVNSPVRGCGKTTLLDVLGRLVLKPLSSANVSTSVIFRVVEAFQPTLLIDEGDAFLRDNDELRGILNSGHRKGGAVLRNVGDEHEPRSFSTYAACAVALIGRLPETLHDRSVVIDLKRRLPKETIRTFRSDKADHLDVLARQAVRWCKDNEDKIADADPAMPNDIFNREADNWRGLIAIADTVGGKWPERARGALEQSHIQSEEPSELVLLLSDIKNIFTERNTDRLPSGILVNHLSWIEGHPWTEYRYGKPITQHQLAAVLKSVQITPQTIRVDSKTTLKGYLKHQFADAFDRYVLEGALISVTP
jgi:hypothetical protein